MKKMLFAALAGMALLAAGCSSNPAAIKGDVPSFVRKPPKDKENFYGLGSAKMGDINMSLTMAQNRARVSIAQQISSQAKSMIDDYSAQVEGDPKTAEKFAQSVARTLSEAKLTNTEIVEQVQTKDGTWWVLISMKKADVNKELSDGFNKEKMNYAEFKNWNAQREMDAAFNKQAGKEPPVVGEWK
ncbi:MAG: LPP20 family lipoprotein [Spirochaetaceae bacterium]|jgi:hypothetical protein|nr:LPP20 family lipoprotein [Spirochaetaceae bacterium]